MKSQNELSGAVSSNLQDTFREFLGMNHDNIEVQEQDLIKNIEEVKESLDRVKVAETKLFHELERKKLKQINNTLMRGSLGGQGISTIIQTEQSIEPLQASPKFTTALNTSDTYVDLDTFPSKIFLTPSVSYQIDKDGKLIPGRETFGYNKESQGQ